MMWTTIDAWIHQNVQYYWNGFSLELITKIKSIHDMKPTAHTTTTSMEHNEGKGNTKQEKWIFNETVSWTQIRETVAMKEQMELKQCKYPKKFMDVRLYGQSKRWGSY